MPLGVKAFSCSAQSWREDEYKRDSNGKCREVYAKLRIERRYRLLAILVKYEVYYENDIFSQVDLKL